MSPVIPISFLIPISLAVLTWAIWHAWKSSQSLPTPLRSSLTILRGIAVGALCFILSNPGRWTIPTQHNPPPWLLLVDHSQSMKQSASPDSTRHDLSHSLVQTAADHAKSQSLPLVILPFSEDLQPATSSESLPKPDGNASLIISSLTRAIHDATTTGSPPAAVILCSDGRQTGPYATQDLDALTLLARSHRTPIHTVAIGADVPPPDLALLQPRASFTAFPGQPIRIPFAIRSSHLPPSRTTVNLTDSTGKTIASTQLDVTSDQTVTSQFDLTAPESSCRWSLETPLIPGESRQANNRSLFSLRIISSKTRVFLAEGAPYWDSKFLAQLLRQQPHIDIRSVHRLSDQRYFRIDSGTTRQPESKHPVFPDSLDELRQYDVVILGKNTDPFLTADRIELLRTYVRDHGGALLFSRGKPTTTEIAALEPLEPVTWAASSMSEFRFSPNSEGAAAGLFGEALPAPEASLWPALPTLKDARSISFVKPFTRVLADATPTSTETLARPTPALLVRRYGQGVTALVNGDGLWKWDFFPEARELGNCYEDFWVQLIQWTTSYSEFLPGQDFSLHLPSLRISPGSRSTATISYRGPLPAPSPTLNVSRPDGSSFIISPALLTDSSGRPQWRAAITPDAPGAWSFRVTDPRPNPPQAPSAMLTIPTPPSESDDLSPDPDFLKSLSQSTGGKFLSPSDFQHFVLNSMRPQSAVELNTAAVWSQSWNHPLILTSIALILAIEWFVRRRNGLA